MDSKRKNIIIDHITNGNIDIAKMLLIEYEHDFPSDYDIYSMWLNIELMLGNAIGALKYGLNSRQKNPFVIETNYNLAECYYALEDYKRALYFYKVTEHLQNIQKKDVIDCDVLGNIINSLIEKMKVNGYEGDIEEVLTYILYETRNLVRTDAEFCGKLIPINNQGSYYLGYADDAGISTHNWNYKGYMWAGKFEIIKIITRQEFFVNNCKHTVLLPFVMNTEAVDNSKPVVAGDKDVAFTCDSVKKFIHLPIKAGDAVYFNVPVCQGEPIPLNNRNEKKRKKLVLNIFIDSFNYSIIEKNGFENLMPNTDSFFEKAYRFTNYYSGSEYTLPSVATYWTGKLPSNHMYIDERYRWDFLGDNKCYPEYFKEAGYVTAMIGENDSTTFMQGYGRGIDRTVFGCQGGGMDARHIVDDVIEHIETFRNSDQFIWMDIQDLHDIAGNFQRSISIEAKCPYEVLASDNNSTTTVRQTRSYNKEKIYIEELKRIDLYLESLYHYIEKHYEDDEIVISLMSDHGTAFLVDNDEHFMSVDRVKIPLLIRTGNKAVCCDELVQTTDYAGIMCRLAGIDYNYEGSDANLPICLGGAQEREYALAQSFYQGDPYQASIHTRDKSIYITSEKVMKSNMQIEEGEYKIYAKSRKDKGIVDCDVRKVTDIVNKEIAHLTCE